MLGLIAAGCQYNPASVDLVKNDADVTTATISDDRYLSFSMVTQEFGYTNEGIEAINHIIDIHEAYNVPLDIIVDDASIQVYAEQAPEVIERLKQSPVVAVSYHIRPPMPYYNKFDFAGLGELSSDALTDKILEYEEHGVDLVTGKPRTGPGGYQFVKDQIGYAPIMAGMITEPTFAPILLDIYAEKGAQFVIEHRGSPIGIGEYRDQLMIRPETIPLIFTEHLTDSPEQLIVDQFESAPDVDGPVFMSIKTHDNDFFATQSAWLSVYRNQAGRGTPQPPFDLSVHTQYAELLSAEEQDSRWSHYEAAVQYASEHQADFTLVNAKRLSEVVTQETITNDNDTTVPPIYLTLISHNEEPGGGRDYPNFLNDEAAFWEHRAAVLNFSTQVMAAGATYHWQSDWNFLQAVAKYDTGTTDTNGKNIVRYISEDLGVHIDPHTHERFYNYADVAYLIKQLGVQPSHIVGGFLVWPVEDSKLEYLWEPITSTLDPTYTWQAEVLWGGASPGHSNDSQVSGIWKPAGADQFLKHSETAPLPHIGGYTNDWEGLTDLLAKQAAGELDDEHIFTVTIMVNQDEMTNPDMVSEVVAAIHEYDDEVAAGRVDWVSLTEVVTIWKNQYQGQPNIYVGNEQQGTATSKKTTAPSFNAQQKTNGGKQNLCGNDVCEPFEEQRNLCPADCL